ncbi:MAG: hypothetical protein EOO40_03750, partial [Deltaproteobacteria bacterium]
MPRKFLGLSAYECTPQAGVEAGLKEFLGLTQLLLSSGQAAGRLLKPPVRLRSAEELLEPRLNARLGGALVGAEA